MNTNGTQMSSSRSGRSEDEATAQAPSTSCMEATGFLPRPAESLTGSEFLNSTAKLSHQEREAAILAEFEKGNLPNFLRQPKELQFSQRCSDGALHQATVQVLPDYLAIGSDEDFVRMPMTATTAQVIAEHFGFSLPTTKIVDAIFKRAEVKLSASPLPPGPWTLSNQYYQKHHYKVEAQRKGQKLGALTAGHKKDVVLTNRLFSQPDRVAIYGWHQPSGKPAQPLDTTRDKTYADYSHGIRLVQSHVVVDGQKANVSEVFRDPVLSALLSHEGPLRLTRQPC